MIRRPQSPMKNIKKGVRIGVGSQVEYLKVAGGDSRLIAEAGVDGTGK
jgi:hypothetical protein